jgi:hypothetical protein
VEIGQNAHMVLASALEPSRGRSSTLAYECAERIVLEPKIHNRAHATSAAYPALP